MRNWGLIGVAALFCGGALADDAADKRAFEAVCGACHSVGLVDGLRSEPEWTETVEQMVKVGAKASDEQFDRLMRYLLRNLTKVNVNSATAREIAPVLDISDAVAEAVIKLRRELGGFKGLDELKKVSGLDAGKIDARKERIVF